LRGGAPPARPMHHPSGGSGGGGRAPPLGAVYWLGRAERTGNPEGDSGLIDAEGRKPPIGWPTPDAKRSKNMY